MFWSGNIEQRKLHTPNKRKCHLLNTLVLPLIVIFTILQVSNKARSTLAFMQRNLKQCSSTLRIQAYLSYVRPIIEYASTVCMATCLICVIKWTTLKLRRNIDKIIMFYKMLNGLVSLEFLNSLQPNTSCTRGHNLGYRQVSTRIDTYLHSYLPSTIQLWNSLPPGVVYSQSLYFKNNLYHYTQ